jgi:uncharacterized protein YbjT (DUF2867 family)
MRFVITGAAGHIAKPLAETLIQHKHEVTVVGRSRANLQGLIDKGANVAVGNLLDAPFLAETLKGADGMYLMLPPMWDADDQRALANVYALAFVSAIKKAGLKNVVFLSSYGAHRLDDAGAISALGIVEQALDTLDGVNVLHLRVGYFYTNLLSSLELVRSQGYLGNMFEIPHGDFSVVHPLDIARTAAQELEALDFKGHSHRYVISDLTGTDEIASVIGNEIGIPALEWVKLPATDVKQTLLGVGLAEGTADAYIEMFTALDNGIVFEHIKEVNPRVGGITIEEFAKEFAAAYNREEDLAH